MRKLIILAVIVLVSASAVAQNRMSLKLQNEINRYPNQSQIILVVGTQRVDGYQFFDENRDKYSTQREFTTAFLNALKKQTEVENLWINELRNQGLEFKILHQFWSVNMVAISASAATIKYLDKHPEVYWMENISEKPVVWDKPVDMSPNYARAVNGREQGITAVKGDSLWAMGYTGKGSKLLTFDTGVWPNHPSFRDQFLGNHVPLSESWYGYDTFFPGDKPGSHGSHVTGTCLGLDPLNSDTIGLAFNAYFLATDPIVENLADVKTVYELMLAYEWAMNPDGDLNTTDDMPDVINNSWGRPISTGDSVVCDGWVNDLFVNLEIAGIVSIHSAGNSGPGASTIGYPAVSNASVVNNFSIGAVNGNSSSLPIASFSSRGPSTCGDTGSLLIKPEIVAPGVAVRSSIRNSNGSFAFANFQGTSMSAPHVSGVALLLREAFPNANATEIKEAMYYSAVDLGAVGEDNTYGMGMLDALASFNYLANTYTPATPQTSNLDIHLTHFNIDNYESYCNPKVIVGYFDNTLPLPNSTLEIELGIPGGASIIKNSNTGTFGMKDSVFFGITGLIHPGWNELYMTTRYFGQLNEGDIINNTRFVRFWVHDETSLPYLENFDSTHVFESSMYVGNPDERSTWDTAIVPGLTRVSNAAMMELSRYSPREYQRDYIQTPMLTIEATDSLMLSFDLSYQLKFTGFADSLFVTVSTDCGQTWGTPVYAKGPTDLNTTTKSSQNNWFPVDSNDWRTELVDLSAYKNEQNIMVRFETANGQGNNLFIDNINVYDDRGVVGVENPSLPNFVMFPNPVENGLLNFNKFTSGVIYNISGFQVLAFEKQKSINVSSLNHGVYLVRDIESNQVYKLIVQ
jgi:bacillopeptidase F